MKINKLLFMCFFFVFFSQSSLADSARYVGFEREDIINIENDLIWFSMRMKKESVFYKIMKEDLESSSGISLDSVSNFLYQHFPLVISGNQEVRRCPDPFPVCTKEASIFSEWDLIPRSDQSLYQNFLKLYTPYLDRNYETTIIGFSPDKILSVKNKNQTIAVINTLNMFNNESSGQEYKRWIKFSQWMALSKMHHIFSMDGEALSECSTNEGKKYLCDPYSNGTMYISSLALIAGSEDCLTCSDNEKIMLKIMAFDHALRSGRNESTDKIVNFIKSSLGNVIKSENDKIKTLIEIYNSRIENPKRGLLN